jgi:hypothetical protein
MLAINTCADRIRHILDIFVHPLTLLKLQHLLNSELVCALRASPEAQSPFDLIDDCRRKQKLDGSKLVSFLKP